MAIQAPAEIEDEYRLLRERAGVVARARGVIEVAGPDAVEFLQSQLTNDVAALAPGTGCYALLLNPKGRILADMRVLVRAPELLWIDTEQNEKVFSNLTMYKIGRQVEVNRRRALTVSVIGPRAHEAVGVELPPNEHVFEEFDIDGTTALAIATDLGVDIIAANQPDAALLEAHLARRGGEQATEEAAEILRIERGRPRYGPDITPENLPGELGLEQRAISFTKGCYVGQEPVARMHYKGHPNRHLRGLLLSEPALAGQVLRRDGKQVGAVTSACVSPTFGPIALALVRREVEIGARVELREGKASAAVVELPFEGT